MRIVFKSLLTTCCALFLFNCGDKATHNAQPEFSKADSITSQYLSLQDSLHQSWNIMINDDNEKIHAMHNLLHELIVTHPENLEEYTRFEERLDQLRRMRYTQKSMGNSDVIEEYDFASNSLVRELLAAAESKKEFAYNTTLQKLVQSIHLADQRIDNYRIEYDSIVMAYNTFIEENRAFLQEVDQSISVEKKPLFQMVVQD